MEPLNEPRIAIKHIGLLNANVEMVNPEGKAEYHLCLTALGRNESPDGKSLTVQAAFDLMHGMENPLFKFNCEFVALYHRLSEQGMPWKDFSTAMALAHIIPYLREFVSSITNRLPAPLLMLNPINVYSMISDYEQRLRRVKESSPEP